nr:FBD-associated F-box protein At1g66320-like [Aegilops tauschii subsp. strangulata]
MAGPDYLMSLPPEMLDDILRRLPFEKLVGTCCLSPAWHRRWESVPGLDIWFSRGSSTARDPRFLLWPCAAPVHKFTACSLWPCAAPIRSFTAHVQRRHSHRPARWLLALAHKRVKMLKLKFDEPWPAHSPRPPVVGPALYSCSTLTHLQLCGYCHLLRAPQGFTGFPNLFTLCLEYVVLPFHGAAAQLQLIISSAPHLTRLLLDDVMIGDDEANIETCAIQAPNLRFLRLTMSLDNGCRIVGDLPLLEVAQISIDPLFGTPNFINTFRRISIVKKLYLHTDSDQVQNYIASNVHGTNS